MLHSSKLESFSCGAQHPFHNIHSSNQRVPRLVGTNFIIPFIIPNLHSHLSRPITTDPTLLQLLPQVTDPTTDTHQSSGKNRQHDSE